MRGWEVARTYTDNDISANGRKLRPGFEAMMSEAESGTVQAVVGWSLDRICRTPRDRLRLLEAGREHGLVISLVRGSDMDLSTPSGRLAADILGAVAQNEIDAKSDRQKRAHQQAAAQGRRIGGRRPFGYEPDGITIRPVEADAVRAAYHDYLAGTPLSVIAATWNGAGLTSGVLRKDGTIHWDHTGVRHVLKNPRYMGMRTHLGEIAGEAQWPALVDESTWRAVQAQLGAVASTFKPKAGRQLLTGIVRCSVCGELLTGGGGKAGTRMYRCPSGRHVCRRAEPVDELILELVSRRLEKGDVVQLVVDAEAPDTRPLVEERDRVTEELRTIALERAQRVITPEQFRLLNFELLGQLKDVEAQIERAGRTDALGAVLASVDPAGRFAKLDQDQKRVIIGSLLSIRLDSAGRGAKKFRPETVHVSWVR